MVRHRKRTFFIFLLMVLFILACTIRSSSACTIFTISNGEKVLFGNNEDWKNPNTYIWFEMPQEGKFGGVYLGFDDFFSQGGMNEKGLCFDANALPEMTLNYHPDLPYCQGWIVKHIIDICANISQTIQVAQEYNWGTSLRYQVQFADASGEAVVISAGTDGELNFTRKSPDDGFLVSTNFNVGYPENGWTPCWRYSTATEMLNDIDLEDNLTVEAVRDVLDSAHQEGMYATRYSNIFDLVNRDIYIYYNYNFKKVVKLNLDEELARGNESYIPIYEFFSRTTTQETQTKKTPEAPIVFLFISLVVVIKFRREISKFD